MNTITETQVRSLADLFSDKKTESTFGSKRIIVDEYKGEYLYDILAETFYNTWEVIHSEDGFTSRDEARDEAESYLDNWDSSDDDYAQ